MKLLSLEVFYSLAGVFLFLVAGRTALDRRHPKRWGSALFWGVLGATFLFGQALPAAVTGYLVLLMVLLAATKQVAGSTEPGVTAAERSASADRLGNWIFVPALLIPGTAVLGTLLLGKLSVGGWWLLDPNPNTITVTSVCLGAVVAVITALRITRAPAGAPVAEGSRMVQA
ncbi:MAG: 5-oxoproline transporter, DUF979 family subunit, partial [Opitutales bacterium]